MSLGVRCSEGRGERARKTEREREKMLQEKLRQRKEWGRGLRGGGGSRAPRTGTSRWATFPWLGPWQTLLIDPSPVFGREDLEHRHIHSPHPGPSTDLFPFKAITSLASAEMAKKSLHTT